MIRGEANLLKLVRSLEVRTALNSIWEIQRLAFDVGTKRSFLRNLPKGGLSATIAENKIVFPWVIEQMANVICCSGSDYQPRKTYLDNADWKIWANFYNRMLSYNNNRSGLFLKNNDIFVTLSKIGHQQFPWQDGALGLTSMARFAFIYCGPHCNANALKQHNLNAEDFLAYGFILVSQFYKNPHMSLPYDLEIVGGDNKKLKAVLERFSISSRNLRSKSRSLRKTDILGEYAKSILRKHPIIKFPDSTYFCPLPQLLIFRITSGLISEISGGAGQVRDEVGESFERYVQKICESCFPKIDLKPEENYGSRKAIQHTPDIRLYEDGLKIILECKATRINFRSKFELDSSEDLPDRIEEISKGFVQIWKYIYDINIGKAPDKDYNSNIYGSVVTLDTWIQLDKDRHQRILEKANKIADDKGLPADCRIKVIVPSIKDIEFVAQRSTFGQLCECFKKAEDGKFSGYMLFNIFGELFPDAELGNLIPNEEILSERIWYWKEARKRAEF